MAGGALSFALLVIDLLLRVFVPSFLFLFLASLFLACFLARFVKVQLSRSLALLSSLVARGWEYLFVITVVTLQRLPPSM